MFTDPTLELFREFIQSHLDQAAEHAVRAVDQIWAQHAARGLLNSGATVKRSLEAAQEAFEKGADAALGELRRAVERTRLDRDELRRITQNELGTFASRAKAAAKPQQLRKFGSGVDKAVNEGLAKIDERLAFKLRQFDAGFFVPAEPEVPPSVQNTMTIGNMYGGAAQQGTHSSMQTATSTVNVSATSAALGSLEAALAELNLHDKVRADLDAEIATLRAQLSKSKPSTSILREAGGSLRSIVEGITASIAAPQVVAAVAALASALGLS